MQTPTPETSKTQQIKDAGRHVGDELRASAHDVADEVSTAGRSVVGSIKTQGAETISALKSEMKSAAHQQQAQFAAGLNGIGQALSEVASTIESEQDSPAFASATRTVARYIDDASHRVASTSPKQLLHTVRDTARTHPALFIGGAALVGFALGRFLRSSNRQNPAEASEQRLPIPQQRMSVTPGLAQSSHVHDHQMDTRRRTDGTFERVNRGAPHSSRRYETSWADPRTHDSLAQDLVTRRAH